MTEIDCRPEHALWVIKRSDVNMVMNLDKGVFLIVSKEAVDVVDGRLDQSDVTNKLRVVIFVKVNKYIDI